MHTAEHLGGKLATMTGAETQMSGPTPPVVAVDFGRMHRERVGRAQKSMRDHGLAASLVFNPLNVQYVSYPGLAIVSSLNRTSRWALVPAEGNVVLWDSFFPGRNPHGWDSGTSVLDEVPSSVPEYFSGEVRLGHGFAYFPCGPMAPVRVKAFAAEVVDVLAERGLRHERIGIDRLDGSAFAALIAAGVEVGDGQMPLERARSVKTVDELTLLRQNARTTAAGLDVLRERLVPGVTENYLWAGFIGSVLSNGAERFATRMLSSGTRTNPWYQEATDRIVREGELVGIDTDLPGRYGYVTDVSRTYVCSDRATDEQRRLYQDAYSFVLGNIPDMQVGASYVELGERIKARCPREYYEQRYILVAHGVGMCDEYPAIKWEHNHDGELEAGMVICVEAYCGHPGGREGVKLEEQVIVTDDGPEIITDCATHDERLLA
jgi:Xaa-Pro aminopeptidase